MRPLLSPCVTPASFSPAFSRPARSIHLTCFGSCPNTVSHILGDFNPCPSDALLSNLRPRVLKSLLQLSSLCNCLPEEILVSGSPSAYATAKLLAEKSLDDGISLEKASPWPDNLPTEICHITAQFYGCCDRLGNGSAGLAVFLETGLQPCGIFHRRVCLGSQCTLQTATYQACGFLLHALLSLFSPLPCMNYSRGPQSGLGFSTIIPFAPSLHIFLSPLSPRTFRSIALRSRLVTASLSEAS